MQEDDDKIIWGAKAIAEEINQSVRATFGLLESGAISRKLASPLPTTVPASRRRPSTIFSTIPPVSRLASYVSPTRGAQGNALKTILAMPFALDGEHGETIIESNGVSHRIGFSIDRIRQEPRISHVRETSPVKSGVRINVRWPDSASSILDDAQPRFLQVAQNYTWVNPHLTLIMEWNRPCIEAGTEPEDNGDDDTEAEKVCQGEFASASWTIAATDPTWRKWRPSDPTSPHWYDEPRLGRLIAAHIAHAEDHERSCPTVREFVSEFRGLSGTAKARAICEAIGAPRMPLTEFYGDGTSCRIGALLSETRNQSRRDKPRDLGPIGKEPSRRSSRASALRPRLSIIGGLNSSTTGCPILQKLHSAIAQMAPTRGG